MFADEIRSYTEDRIHIVMNGAWSGGPMGRGDVLEIAESMLPAHEKHSPSLNAEMLAMAAAAGISPAESIVVGGFTDFVDTVRSVIGGEIPQTLIEDDCTAFIVPDSRANGQGFFAQTWDMHDSATEHVVLFRVQPEDGPDSLVFTTVGALGQIGMNEVGVCVGINNITSLDGQPGVIWTNVVRDALLAESAEDARDAVLDADLAGGHNFLLFDAEGSGYSIEAMPSVRPIEELHEDALVHTNHTLDPAATAVQGPRAEVLQDSSRRRLATAQAFLERDGVEAEDLMELTREPDAVCQVAVEPYHVESSGATVMRPKTKEFWACWGLPSMNEFERIDFP
jgi:isopenicillin-N N-acyltransferase-like protein